jgi:hypothetical protein
MPSTNSRTIQTHNGFAIPLQPDTELGLAMLIAESEKGQHEPVAVVATIGEAREIAADDFRARRRRLERGEDPSICPATYTVWARGVDVATGRPALSTTSRSAFRFCANTAAGQRRAAFAVVASFSPSNLRDVQPRVALHSDISSMRGHNDLASHERTVLLEPLQFLP